MNAEPKKRRRYIRGAHLSEDELIAHRDDTLDDQDEERIRTHIESCDECLEQFLELVNKQRKDITPSRHIGHLGRQG